MSPVWNVSQPPSMNLSFCCVFGSRTGRAPFCLERRVLQEAEWIWVSHTLFLLVRERSREGHQMPLLILNSNIGSLQRMSLNLFILWRELMFNGKRTTSEIRSLGLRSWLCPKLAEESWVSLSSSVIMREFETLTSNAPSHSILSSYINDSVTYLYYIYWVVVS